MRKLVLDSSVLNPFARANRLSDLERLTRGHSLVTTRAVLEEVSKGVPLYPMLAAVPQLPWLGTVAVDSLPELGAFAEYVRILGPTGRNIGESSILAHAEINGAIAFTDDQAAVNAGKSRGVTVRRSLAVITEGVKRQLLSRHEASALIDDLICLGGARLPCDGESFLVWAANQGLLHG